MKEIKNKIIFFVVMTLVAIQSVVAPVMTWLYIKERKKAKQLENFCKEYEIVE